MTEATGDHAFAATGLYGTEPQPAYAGALSFMRRKYTRDLAGVDVAVSGIPFDLATSNRPGTRFGPAGIRRASGQLAYGKVWPWGFDPFDRLAVMLRVPEVVVHLLCQLALGAAAERLGQPDRHFGGYAEATVAHQGKRVA